MTEPAASGVSHLIRELSDRDQGNTAPLFRFIDLFAGIGGMRLAFESIGGECVFTSEWNAYSRKTYEANFPVHHPFAGDITKVAEGDIPPHDVLVAGFPCQPFSIAGVSKKNALGLPHGFKDVTHDEFWIQGHMPGFPLMPGVILCEASAQLAGFYARKYNILQGGDYLGFGGMDTVRFRLPVYPGSRLIILARATRVMPRILSKFEFQGFVDDKLVFDGQMIGVPISRNHPTPVAKPE